jgi:DNA polymerase-1
MDKQIIKSVEEFQTFLSTCDKVVVFDTETTSLNYVELELVGFSLCDGKQACYVDVFENAWGVKIIDCLRDWIAKCNLVIMHNAPYDLMVLYKLIIRAEPKVFCTQTAAHILDENRSKGLKNLVIEELGVHPSEVESWEQAAKEGYHSPRFHKYGMNDAIWTYQLYEKFRPEILRQGLGYVFFDIEMPFQYVLRDLGINGVLVDKDALARETLIARQRVYDIQKRILDRLDATYTVQHNMVDGSMEIVSLTNLNSPKQVIEIFEHYGLEITETTDGGAPSVGKNTLTRHRDHEFVSDYIKYKTYVKLLTGFLEPLPSKIDADGRVRTSFNNTVAVTGRLSSSNPNLQNLTKEETLEDICVDEDPLSARCVFVAGKGNVLVGADYSGQELRVIAEESQDPTMIEAFHNKQDLHLTVANEQFGLGIPSAALVKDHEEYGKYKKQHSSERSKAKTIDFGIAYGKTSVGFAADWNVSRAEATKVVNGYFGRFPKIKEAIDKSKKEVKSRLFVSNLAGRRRRFVKATKRAFRQAFNFKIQGYSADMLKIAMVHVRYALQELDGVKLVLTVHDEIVVECYEDQADLVVKIVEYEMKNAVKLCVPLEVDVNVGQTYAEIK